MSIRVRAVHGLVSVAEALLERGVGWKVAEESRWLRLLGGRERVMQKAVT